MGTKHEAYNPVGIHQMAQPSTCPVIKPTTHLSTPKFVILSIISRQWGTPNAMLCCAEWVCQIMS